MATEEDNYSLREEWDNDYYDLIVRPVLLPTLAPFLECVMPPADGWNLLANDQKSSVIAGFAEIIISYLHPGDATAQLAIKRMFAEFHIPADHPLTMGVLEAFLRP